MLYFFPFAQTAWASAQKIQVQTWRIWRRSLSQQTTKVWEAHSTQFIGITEISSKAASIFSSNLHVELFFEMFSKWFQVVWLVNFQVWFWLHSFPFHHFEIVFNLWSIKDADVKHCDLMYFKNLFLILIIMSPVNINHSQVLCRLIFFICLVITYDSNLDSN